MFIGIVILLVVVLAMYMIVRKLYKDSGIIYSTLDAFKTKATVAENDIELRHISLRLCAYVDTNCWHRHHVAYANNILSYIQGRLSHDFPAQHSQ
jgi:hypothetical protein